MYRGELTDITKEKACVFLGREIDKDELRLYPYIDYCIKNAGKLEFQRLSAKERDILKVLEKSGYIKLNSTTIYISKLFYNFISEILWESYIVNKKEDLL